MIFRLDAFSKRCDDFSMIDQLFDMNHTIASDLLCHDALPYMALSRLHDYILSAIQSLGSGYRMIADGIAVHESATISGSAVLLPPLIIGKDAELRTGAFIRGSAIIGERAVIGNSVEIKNSVVFDDAEIPHLSYIGDSIIGYKAHFGAGAMTSNVRADKASVKIHIGDRTLDTGLAKLGALVGDYAEIGCNAVLNPGTVIGRHSNVYPLSCVRGYVPSFSICKTGGIIVAKRGL